MKKDINIDSSEWCDVIFEGKNKAYGAYHLRQSSSKRHIVAFLTVMLLMAGVVAIPNLVSAVKNMQRETAITTEGIAKLSEIPIDKQLPEENIVKQEQAPPPPPLKPTVKFTPPVISRDDDVADDEEMAAISDLLDNPNQISKFNVKGDDINGVDLADLPQIIVPIDPPKDEDPVDFVEQMPQFPGGERELNTHISKNLKYPIPAQENGIQGRVIIRFVVTASGEISDVKVMRGIDSACDKEAVRVVKSMPRWIPGKQNGRNVAVYFTLPIIFKLNN